MKKVLFSMPLLALAMLFTFCNKTNVQEEASFANPNTQAPDRAGVCYLQIWGHNYDVRLCGTGMNTNACSLCGTAASQGTFVYSPTLVSTNVMAPTTFSVTSTAPVGEFITLTTASNQIGPVFLPAGGCLTFKIDDTCTLF